MSEVVWPDGVFDQTASGLAVSGFSTTSQTMADRTGLIRNTLTRAMARTILLDMDPAPGLHAPLRQPGVECSSFLGSLFQPHAVLLCDLRVLLFLGLAPLLPSQLPQVEGTLK